LGAGLAEVAAQFIGARRDLFLGTSTARAEPPAANAIWISVPADDLVVAEVAVIAFADAAVADILVLAAVAVDFTDRAIAGAAAAGAKVAGQGRLAQQRRRSKVAELTALSAAQAVLADIVLITALAGL
jgi:hypothetical protein